MTSHTSLRAFTLSLLAATALSISACSPKPKPETSPVQTTQTETGERVITQNFTADRFTQSNYTDIRVTHIDLDLDVNFYAKILDAAMAYARANSWQERALSFLSSASYQCADNGPAARHARCAPDIFS